MSLRPMSAKRAALVESGEIRTAPGSTLGRSDAELARGPGPERRKRVNAINPERRAREWARAYGSLERCYFVSAVLSCVVETCETDDGDYLDNAHGHTGGMGRKGDYTTVFPACRAHHTEHDAGRERFALKYGVDIDLCCAETERAWLEYGAEVVARSKRDGRFERWLDRREDA